MSNDRTYDLNYDLRKIECENPVYGKRTLKRGFISDEIIGDVTVSLDIFKFMDGAAAFRKWVLRVFANRFMRGDWGILKHDEYDKQSQNYFLKQYPFYGVYHYEKDEIDIMIVCYGGHTVISNLENKRGNDIHDTTIPISIDSLE